MNNPASEPSSRQPLTSVNRLPVPPWPPWSRWVLAALGYLFFTLLVTYPVAFQMSTRMAGESTGDTLEFVWSTWWWKHALLDLHQSPIQISVLNHPMGVEFPLLPLMSQSFLLALPLTALASPVFAYNFVFLSSFVLCGLAGYALCAELSGDALAGFLGGLIWAFFPNKMGHALAGHLFQLVIFAFPLMALSWIRLLRTPTSRNAIWAGLALVLASIIHPIYLAYFVAPFLMALIGNALWAERRAFWTREKTQGLTIALGVTAILLIPLLLPTLSEMRIGSLSFLAERDPLDYSFDFLAYFLPPAHNPFLLHWFGQSPVADLANRVMVSEYESLGYLGWVPLVLAAFGAWVRWGESRLWAMLAIVGSVLALGSVLKWGGNLVQVPTPTGAYPILLPYALVSQLPLLAWSRTSARLDVIVMLPLSVLATFGFSALRRFEAPRRLPGVVLLGGVSLIVMAEYVVKFPFPTLPAAQPGSLETLRREPLSGGVIQLPIPDNNANLRSLYWQTVHQHPLVWGRVYRDIPETRTEHDFLSQVLISEETADIFPLPTDEQRRAMLAESNVEWVLDDAQADPGGAARARLEARLGPPQAEDEALALFKPDHAKLRPDDLVWALGVHWSWYPVQDWGGRPGRWFDKSGLIYVYSGSERTTRLAFTAIPGPGPDLHRLAVQVNGAPVGQFVVGDWAEYYTDSFTLKRGLNFIQFLDLNGSYPWVGDPRCLGRSPISGPYLMSVPCEPNDRTERDLSLALSGVRLIAESTLSSFTPSGALFGDSIRLLGFNMPDHARPGDRLKIHLIWQATAASPEDYTVFLHLYGPNGALVAQNDGWPVNSAYPTSRWEVGEVIAYNMSLTLPEGIAPGAYTAKIGLYRWPSLERLPVSETPETQDAAVPLATVTVPR